MKKQYQKPLVEHVELRTQQVICGSGIKFGNAPAGIYDNL